MNPFSKTAPSLSVLFLLTFFSTRLFAAPSLSLSLDSTTITVKKPFYCVLTIAWTGDPDRYLVDRPRLTPPAEMEMEGSSSRSVTRGEDYLLEYRYHLRALKAGTYVLGPAEISYWEKGTTRGETARTETITINVIPFALAPYLRYWPLGAAAITFISLFSAIIVISTKKKRRARNQGHDTPPIRSTIEEDLKRCNACRVTGEWESFIRTAITIRDRLPSGEDRGRKLEELDALAEKIHYGGFEPTAEEVSLILRQLETAVRKAFPHDGETDLTEVEFR